MNFVAAEQEQLNDKQVENPKNPKDIEGQLHPNQEELDRIKTQLNQTEALLTQSQTQLREIHRRLEKSQGHYGAHVKNLIGIVWESIHQERLDVSIYAQGGMLQSARIASVAEYCAKGWPGDFIEIGCLRGGTTIKIAEVARRYQRRVIAVDPWQTGTQNCEGGEYEAFLKNTENYRDIIDIVREDSLKSDTIAAIASKELCFAFVDGLHTYEACLRDIQTVAHCSGVIAVDDTSWSRDVERALREGAELTHRSYLYIPILRESYLLWNQ